MHAARASPPRPPFALPPPPPPPPRPLHRLQRPQRAPPHHRHLVPRKLVLAQQLPHFHFHQIQQLRIVHHVYLVQKHHDVRHPDLPRQQNVLPRLRHRPVRRRYHQNRPIHLRRPGDHVLDVVRVPRTVHVRVVPLLRLVLHVADRDRDPPLLLLRRVVDLVEPQRPRLPQRRQHPGDRRRQRRLPVVDVPNRPHVHVRLRPLKSLLGHEEVSPCSILARSNRRVQCSLVCAHRLAYQYHTWPHVTAGPPTTAPPNSICTIRR